jgi:hypothetical protein
MEGGKDMEPQTTNGDLAYLILAVEALEKARAHDCIRLENIERELANSVKRRDSIEVAGTRNGGIGGKAYVDLLGDPKENERALEEQLRLFGIVDKAIPRPPPKEKKQEGGA